MVFCRSWCLAFVLLFLANNHCFSQQSPDRSGKYWKNSEAKKNRLALHRFQTEERDEEDFESDDTSAPDFSDDFANSENVEQDARAAYVWPEKSIQSININPTNQLAKKPNDRSFMLNQQFTRNWHQFESVCKNYRWQSPCISYQPLYFEDVALERYGQSRPGFQQTIVSAAHFFNSFALLPLHMRTDPPYSCEYPLGYCRPGNCTNVTRQKLFWW